MENLKLLPSQLESWRFILICPKEKIPPAEMKGWAKNREQMTFKQNDEALLTYIKAGGNYAVITGEDRFVLAADTKEVEQAIESRLPKTFTVISPRHKTKHFYYYGKITKFVTFKPTTKGDPCCDLKYGNAYVLGAGSEYDSYGKYKTADDVPVATTTEEAVLAAIDEFILSKIDKPEEIPEDQNETKLNPQLSFDITKLLPNLDAYTENNNILTGPHPQHGSATGSNFRIDLKKNTWHCFRNGHESGGGPLQLLAVMQGLIKCEECHKGALRGTKFQLAVAKAQELGLLGPLQIGSPISSSDEPGADNEALDMPIILYNLKSQFTFKTPTDLEDIYYYDNGVYVFAEHKIKALLESWLGSEASTHLINEVLDHIRRSSYVERTEFNKFKGSIPVQNGLLNLETQTLKPFSKDEIFTYKLNVNYKSESKCPKWLKFLSEVLQPEDVFPLQEYMGYCLYPAMPYHVLMWFYGKGRNGKGRITATIEEIIGPKNCAHLNVEEFNGDRRFSTEGLYGKMVNISSEPATIKTLQTPLLKKLTGEDVIDAEVKNKQRRLCFMNMAKFFILGNRFPKINDTTLAFWDRVLLIPFPKSFLGKERRANVEREWLDDPEEVSGILNWMLDGLHRLSQQKQFTKSNSMEETMLDFKRNSDSVGAWLDEKVTFDTEAIYVKATAFDNYKEYSDDIGATPETQNKFYARIRDTPKIRDTRIRINGEFVHVFKGIKPKVELSEDKDTPQTTLVDTPFVPTLPTLPSISDSNNLDKKEVRLIEPEKVGTSGKVGTKTEEEEPKYKQLVCFFCGRGIMDNDWMQDNFSENKPAHSRCYNEKQDQLKGNYPEPGEE
jgi:P4 family phage/plasmid primase-like protien